MEAELADGIHAYTPGSGKTDLKILADVNDAEEESAGQDTPMGTLYFVNFDEEEEEQMQDGPYDTEQMMYEDFMYGDIDDYYDD